MKNLEREIQFYPAWDRRSLNPKKNYGIHGVEMVWLLKGPKGVIQFKVFTNWNLPKTQKEIDRKICGLEKVKLNIKYQGVDITDSVETNLKPNSQLWVEEQKEFNMYHLMHKPMAADLGYHSPKPMHKGHKPFDCDLIPGGKCYYDGSGLNAERIFEILCREGDEAVWKEMENYYYETFFAEIAENRERS